MRWLKKCDRYNTPFFNPKQLKAHLCGWYFGHLFPSVLGSWNAETSARSCDCTHAV